MANSAVLAVETFEVTVTTVHCDGGDALGHPRIYLRLDSRTNQAVCPYCSRQFILKKGVSVSAAH